MRAYDLLANTPSLSITKAERIRRGLFDQEVNYLLRWTPEYGNLDPHLIRGLLEYGMVFGNREWFERGLQWYDAIQKVGFYADGFWHEGSPAYHRDVTWR